MEAPKRPCQNGLSRCPVEERICCWAEEREMRRKALGCTEVCCRLADPGACPEYVKGPTGRCLYCDHGRCEKDAALNGDRAG